MIIKSIHVGETDLIGCLIRKSEENEFIKFLRLDLLRDMLKSPTKGNRHMIYYISLKQF